MEEEFPILADLRHAYLDAGGGEEDWQELVHGLHHPQWALHWMDSGDAEHSKRLDELGLKSLSAGNIIEYEVREIETGTVCGLALGLIKVYRHSRSQTSLEVRHLTSTDPHYSDWASYHINEESTFHLHLCKKDVKECGANPSSKKVGWVHVGRFRMATFISALTPQYDCDAILDALRDRVETLIGTFSPVGIELRPRVDAPEAEVSGGEDFPPVPPRDVPRKEAMKAAAPKSGEGRGKAKKPEPEEPKKKKRKEFEEAEKADKGLEAKRAKASALEATKALMGGHPQMLRTAPSGVGERLPGGRPGQEFLDHLSMDEGVVPEKGDRDKRPRKTGGGPPGGGDGGDDDDDKRDDDKKKHFGRRGDSSEEEKKKKKEKKKRKRSSSSSRKAKADSKARASHIFPVGGKKKKQRGDPSDDPGSSSSHGGKGKKDKDRKKDKKKAKADRRNKKRDRSGSTSSKSGSSEDSQAAFYGKDTARYESLAEKARKQPGTLLKSGLIQMSKFLAVRTGGTDEEAGRSWRDQRVGAYLNQVLFAQHPQEKLGMRNVRELVTLAEAIDLLMEGQFAAVGDVLMQRMKAVETSVTDGWQLASHQELIPPAKATLSTNLERSYVARQALQARKLEESIKGKKG